MTKKFQFQVTEVAVISYFESYREDLIQAIIKGSKFSFGIV